MQGEVCKLAVTKEQQTVLALKKSGRRHHDKTTNDGKCKVGLEFDFSLLFFLLSFAIDDRGRRKQEIGNNSGMWLFSGS
jgi:hypothetical protein